jgi:hypothetical protein
MVCHCAHLCFTVKQATLLMQIPLIFDTFLIHFDELAMDFGKVNVFLHSKIESPSAPMSQSAGLVIDMVLYKGLWQNNQFTQWLSKLVGTRYIVWWQFLTFKNFQSVTCAGSMHKWFTLEMTLVYHITGKLMLISYRIVTTANLCAVERNL